MKRENQSISQIEEYNSNKKNQQKEKISKEETTDLIKAKKEYHSPNKGDHRIKYSNKYKMNKIDNKAKIYHSRLTLNRFIQMATNNKSIVKIKEASNSRTMIIVIYQTSKNIRKKVVGCAVKNNSTIE